MVPVPSGDSEFGDPELDDVSSPDPHAASTPVAAMPATNPRREIWNFGRAGVGDIAYDDIGGSARPEVAVSPATFGDMSKPLGPYTPVVRAGDFVIVSGQGGMRDGVKVDGGVSAETTQTMANVAAQLATVGASLTDIVKTTCFLTDMENFTAFNEAYAEALGSHRPARSTVAVAGLPANFLVEVEAWAYLPQG